MNADAPRKSWSDALQALAALVDEGRSQEALAATGRLFAEPDLPPWLAGEACNLAGAAAFALGLTPLSETLWREAIARGNPSAQPHFNLGVLLAAQQRDDEAEAAWREAARIDPRHADAWLQLAALLARRQRAAEADAAYRIGRRLAPDNALASNNHGALLVRLGHWADAEVAYREALRVAPDDVAVLANLGVVLAETHRLAEAESLQRRAIAVDPGNAAAHANLGLVLQALEQLDAAEACHRQALALNPASAEIHTNLGNLLARLPLGHAGSNDEAERCHRRAIELDPASAQAHVNLGVLLTDQRRDDEAEALLRHALELRPGYPLARLDLSFLLLAQGRWDEGWPMHEARHDPDLIDNGIPPPDLPLPAWQGEPLAGRSVLVWAEQGLGDQIQFSRYVALLKQQGAARVTLVCQTPLKALFATLAGPDEVLAADVVDNHFVVRDGTVADHDFWVFPLSLPRHFRTTVDDIPVAPPYLHASPERVAAWADRAAAPGLRVGLVWRGNPRHHNDAERSLPGLASLAPLWRVAGTSFFSLQTGSAGEAARETLPGQPLQHLGGELRDFADTAAVLAQLDLLICVDTSIAHLAGALGTPCWLLLPTHKTDWRWLRDRNDTPWYPGTMRIFRQRQRGDWSEVIEQVRVALSERVASGKGLRQAQPERDSTFGLLEPDIHPHRSA